MRNLEFTSYFEVDEVERLSDKKQNQKVEHFQLQRAKLDSTLPQHCNLYQVRTNHNVYEYHYYLQESQLLNIPQLDTGLP